MSRINPRSKFRLSELPSAQLPEYVNFLPEEFVDLEVETVKEGDLPHSIFVSRYGHSVCRLRTHCYSILVIREQPC